MVESRPHICVIGAGTMGRGIAQVALSYGHLVSLVDPSERQLEAATAEIIDRLGRTDPEAGHVAAGRLTAASSVTTTTAHAGTITIEAVVEDLSVKQEVLSTALQHYGDDCILATNTSSLSITQIAATVPDPSRVVGMHFFNPVPVMKLVEVVRGLQTEIAVAEAVAALAVAWGKRVAQVSSSPGFIVNRVARAYYGEALKLLEEGAATPPVLDELMRSAGFRMGPFELMDLIGVEVNLAVTRTVWEAYNFDPRFAPSRIQTELVASGRLGRKSGRGFYRYGADIERTLPEPVRPIPGDHPTVRLHGHDDQLDTFLERAGIAREVCGSEGDETASVELVGLGSVVISRGLTAQHEARMRGVPVVVSDRCLDPATTSAVALASSGEPIAGAWVGILDKAGIRAYRLPDVPGLVLCRILSMIANEAWEAAHQGVAAPADIDTAMLYGTNYPAGPFAWCAEWGAPYVLDVLDRLWSEYHDPRYRASQLLRSEARRDSAD
jgi:3-hydroxybutyryl-CoA dehydrogenase